MSPKATPNIKKFFNAKSFFVGSVTFLTILVISFLLFVYLIVTIVELHTLCPLSHTPNFLFLLLILLSILFFLWQKSNMKKAQKIFYLLVAIPYFLYCTIPHLGVFFPECNHGDLSILYCIDESFSLAMLFFLFWFGTQVASVFIKNKTFWNIILLLFVILIFLIFCFR